MLLPNKDCYNCMSFKIRRPYSSCKGAEITQYRPHHARQICHQGTTSTCWNYWFSITFASRQKEENNFGDSRKHHPEKYKACQIHLRGAAQPGGAEDAPEKRILISCSSRKHLPKSDMYCAEYSLSPLLLLALYD